MHERERYALSNIPFSLGTVFVYRSSISHYIAKKLCKIIPKNYTNEKRKIMQLIK